jgi:LmbE family N-acetylglucosaminyl deacetylase
MFEGKKILIVGAHPDDIEFGMGGTLNQLDKKNIYCVVFSDTVNLNGETILGELENSLSKIYKVSHMKLIRSIENMNFVNQEREIKQKLYDIKQEFKPDVIFSTSRKSFNPDHQVLGVSCLNVFQEQTVLFYEVVRGDYEFQPNLYNEISEEDAEIKQDAIRQYVSQTKKRDYAKSSIILSQLIFRGSQVSKRYAEAFEVGRIVL